MPSQPDIVAAGAVVVRKGGDVLLVHRPKYDDWSFPKGKLDRGEHVTACAVREVREETGLDVRLGRPLSSQRYPTGSGMKAVHYWVARVVGDDDVSGYTPNAEIDEVVWASFAKAERLLSYLHDRNTLREATTMWKKTRTLVVLRHARARSRSRWRSDDRFRPLIKTGAHQSAKLVPLLASYDVRRLVSSSSVRCVSTLVPYADAVAGRIETHDSLSEEGATPSAVVELVDDLLSARRHAVVCTHRPVLPDLFHALGLADPELEPGEMLVVHHRNGEVVGTESHFVS